MKGSKRNTGTNLIMPEGLMPSAEKVERVILGTAMMESSTMDEIAELLVPDAFYNGSHQKIYQAILSLHNENRQIDILTVHEQLVKTGMDKIVESPGILLSLTGSVTSGSHISSHIKIVYEKYLQRKIILLGIKTANEGYAPDADVFTMLDDMGREFHNLSTGHQKSKYQSLENTTFEVMKEIEAQRHRTHDVTGVPTGFKILDRITCGWQPGDLIIIAARPSVGKSAFAINLARNAAASNIRKTSVGIFSLEMSAGSITRRLQSSESKIPLEKILRARMDDADMERLHHYSAAVAKLKIFIDDTTFINIYELRAKARRMVEKDNVGLIIVDYLQLMSGTGEGGKSIREQEISAISRGLKGLAKELGVPIIALSQVSRDIEKRNPPKPVLSDLRESGAIEQDADIVIFLSRTDYQKEESEVDPALLDKAEIKFAKNRNGPLETLPFYAVGKIVTWMDEEQHNIYNLGPSWKAVQTELI
jgi:replicative DNA helicase